MSEANVRLFSFFDQRDHVLVYEKLVIEPLFQIQIPGLEINISTLTPDAAKLRLPAPQSDAEQHQLVRLKARQLIGLKMNLTLQQMKIISSRSESEVSKLAKDSLYNLDQTKLAVSFAAAEKELLIYRINLIFDEWAKTVMLKSNATEVEAFFKHLKDNVVMGPFVAANILDERVES